MLESPPNHEVDRNIIETCMVYAISTTMPIHCRYKYISSIYANFLINIYFLYNNQHSICKVKYALSCKVHLFKLII